MKQQPSISVGIMAEPAVDFLLESPYSFEGTTFTPGIYVAERKGNNLVIRGQGVMLQSPGIITLQPVSIPGTFMLKNVTIGIHFHWEQKEDQRFTGSLRFMEEEDNVRVINILPLEEYLQSVISSEMSATASPDLLKAHAVISRGWLVAQLEKTKQIAVTGKKYDSAQIAEDEIIRWYDREDHHNFDVCADDHCQRYQGITKILTGKATDAVQATRGEVLVSGKEICDARFSKCCGGISESFENVWEPEKKSYLTAIGDQDPPGGLPSRDLREEYRAVSWISSAPEAFCHTTDQRILSQVLPDFDQKTRDFYRWKVEYRQEELSDLIRKRSGIDFGSILKLEPVQRGFSGRIIRLRIVGTLRTLVVGKELEIRKWLSPSHLYSSAFFAEYGDILKGIPGKIILHGAGWGHGVGLCQIGAAVMGEKGYNYRDILYHYFRNAIVTKLYEQ